MGERENKKKTVIENKNMTERKKRKENSQPE
jgi:hypothetical protein